MPIHSALLAVKASQSSHGSHDEGPFPGEETEIWIPDARSPSGQLGLSLEGPRTLCLGSGRTGWRTPGVPWGVRRPGKGVGDGGG